MTGAKHTPGPWVTDGTDVCQTNHGGLHVIAQMSVPICGEENWREVELANARLIAAAPEQHAALLPVARAFDDYLTDASRATEGGYHCEDDHLISLTLTAAEWQACRAAIAKATGEEIDA